MIEKVIISINLVLSLWKDLFWYSITSSRWKNYQDGYQFVKNYNLIDKTAFVFAYFIFTYFFPPRAWSSLSHIIKMVLNTQSSKIKSTHIYFTM